VEKLILLDFRSTPGQKSKEINLLKDFDKIIEFRAAMSINFFEKESLDAE